MTHPNADEIAEAILWGEYALTAQYTGMLTGDTIIKRDFLKTLIKAAQRTRSFATKDATDEDIKSVENSVYGHTDADSVVMKLSELEDMRDLLKCLAGHRDSKFRKITSLRDGDRIEAGTVIIKSNDGLAEEALSILESALEKK